MSRRAEGSYDLQLINTKRAQISAELYLITTPGIATAQERTASLAKVQTLIDESIKLMRGVVAPPYFSPAYERRLKDLELAYANLIPLVQGNIEFLKNNNVRNSNNGNLTAAIERFDKLMAAYNARAEERWGQLIKISNDQYFRNLTISIAAFVLLFLFGYITWRWVNSALFVRLELACEHCRIISHGNLVTPIDIGHRDEIGTVLSELSDVQTSLSAIVSEVRNSAETIYSSAQEISSGSNDLSSRTEEQASALQQTAASMEQLKITVKHNAENAHHANQLAIKARQTASEGGDAVHSVVKTMQEIATSSRRIADINRVIDGIAHQTNILALNAAVEAARAGEQGRGFAVVAGEVRNLAKRSADAAKEIHTLIESSVQKVVLGSSQADDAGKTMQEIVQSVSKVSEIIGEITLASDEQSIGISQISEAVNEMDQVTQQNAALVEQSACAAQSLQEQAHTLNTAMSIFTINNVSASPKNGFAGMAKVPMTSLSANRGGNLRLEDNNKDAWERF
nr:methyl-accepting chemotaxis protein [Biostraticola tofi]